MTPRKQDVSGESPGRKDGEEAPMTIAAKSTPELLPGDVILTFGMQVRIESIIGVTHSPSAQCGDWRYQESRPFEVPSAGIAPDGEGERCLMTYAWDGRVLNLEEVLADGFVPRSFLYDAARSAQGPGHGREDQWTVQGNRLRNWAVVRAAGQAGPAERDRPAAAQTSGHGKAPAVSRRPAAKRPGRRMLVIDQ